MQQIQERAASHIQNRESYRRDRLAAPVVTRDLGQVPYVRDNMLRDMKQKAAWLIAASVLLSGLSFAQPRDHDDDYKNNTTKDYRRDHDKDRDRDHDHDRDRDKDRGRDDHRWNDHDRDDHRWNDHDRDDHRWNDHDRDDRYRNNGNWGYQNDSRVYPYPRSNSGYYGYPSSGGYYGYPSTGGYYPNSPYYGGGGGGYGGYGNYGGRGNSGYNFGYQDGAMVARQDMAENKPYHPDVRGKYEDADHGYNSGMGDKQYYRAQYKNGYRAGYVAAFRGGRRYQAAFAC